MAGLARAFIQTFGAAPRLIAFLTLILVVPLAAQDKKPAVDQGKVDEAISRGCEFLLKQNPFPLALGNADMLVLLTLIHGGVSLERIQPYVHLAMNKELDWTYNVSLMAMCLYELWKLEKDPEAKEKIVARMRDCAQWLVDNQTSNGQWRYGFRVPPAPTAAEPAKEPMIGTEGAGGKPASGTASPSPASLAGSKKKKVSPQASTALKVAASKRAYGTDGDNSNSQYAALGLRACMDVGIEIPKEVLDLAIKFIETVQEKDGGWGYCVGGQPQLSAWGSMTAGAVGALSIYKYYLSGDMKQVQNDPSIVKGLKWIEKNFAVDRNPLCAAGNWHMYYLYGLERAGMLYGTEVFGSFPWYTIGAEHLLKNQKDDGSWKSNQTPSTGVPAQETQRACWDTCFAILFLRRATRPLTIESGKSK